MKSLNYVSMQSWRSESDFTKYISSLFLLMLSSGLPIGCTSPYTICLQPFSRMCFRTEQSDDTLLVLFLTDA